MENKTNTSDNGLAISCKVKHTLTKNSTPREIKIYISTKSVPKCLWCLYP